MSENGEFEPIRALIWPCATAGGSPGPSRSRSRMLLPRAAQSRFPIRRTFLYRSEDHWRILSSRVPRAVAETVELQLLAECRRGTGSRLSAVSAVPPRDGAGNACLAGYGGQRHSRDAPHRSGCAGQGRVCRRSRGAIGVWLATFETAIRSTSRSDPARGGEDAAHPFCGSAHR